MALVRVRAAAQLTLPAEVRKALKIEDGDYLEAEIVEGGVLLRPVAVVDRQADWKRLVAATRQVQDRRRRAPVDPIADEKAIAREVRKARQDRKTNA